ncbi:MAG: hypothetical protein ACI83D_000607, partial [Planctomycetota bacterium]
MEHVAWGYPAAIMLHVDFVILKNLGMLRVCV